MTSGMIKTVYSSDQSKKWIKEDDSMFKCLLNMPTKFDELGHVLMFSSFI